MQIHDKTFIVTGGSRGIGRALAETIVRSGGRVAFNGRKKKDLERALARLKELGGEAIAVPGDVGADRDAKRLADKAYAAFGEVDALVNNAAILAPRALVVDTAPEVWEEVLRVNVIGTANMIRHVLPRMEKRGQGIIVNMSSGWGREASGWVASYCASKFAVEALTQSVSEETQGSGVIVFALNPGIIATEMLDVAFDGDIDAYPPPEKLSERWKNLFEKVARSWHGSSRDLLDY